MAHNNNPGISMIKQFLTATLLTVAASSSFAAEPAPFYVGADVGSTKFDGVSDRTTSYGAFAGYQFNQYVGAELGYRRLGDITVTSGNNVSSGGLDQVSISVLGTLPLTNGFGALLRYGRVQFRQDGSNIDNEHRDGALFGIGLQYAYSTAVAVRLEVQKPAHGVNNLSAGVFFKF